MSPWGGGGEKRLSPTFNAIAKPGASSKANEAKGWMPQARESLAADNIYLVGQPQFKKFKKKVLSQHSMKYDTELKNLYSSSRSLLLVHHRGVISALPVHVTFFLQATIVINQDRQT